MVKVKERTSGDFNQADSAPVYPHVVLIAGKYKKKERNEFSSVIVMSGFFVSGRWIIDPILEYDESAICQQQPFEAFALEVRRMVVISGD